MDKALRKIALGGRWADRSGRSISDDLKDDTIGDRRPYIFFCPYCDREFRTRRKYRVTGNMASEAVRSGIFWGFRDLIWSTLHRIPIIGQYLGDAAERSVVEQEERMEERRDDRTLLQAFREVEESFVRCGRCGGYTCESCMENGVCGFCRDGTSPD
ncbi:hypothetical protein JW921_07635 [Candidatus Fermentibacterales bacterium]|nr:hypothetical protein [Candidatus Fermentibacterales bacterium]